MTDGSCFGVIDPAATLLNKVTSIVGSYLR